jgi:TolA-binding protein
MFRNILLTYLVPLIVLFTTATSISAEVDQTADKLIASYENNTDLASTLIKTAGDYIWNRKYDEAQRLYQAVNDKQPDTVWGIKSRLGLSRLDILNLIEQKEFEKASQRVDSIITAFKNEQDLSAALFHIGQEFFWQRKFADAFKIFEKGLEMFPNSYESADMRLWKAKAGCCALILRKAPQQEIAAAIDKMINDFQGNLGLPEAVYWISKEYEWAKGTVDDRTDWLSEPNSVYERLIQQFSSSSFAQEAEWDKKRLAHRLKIFELIKETDQDKTNAAVDKMVVEFSGRPELVDELHWIACGYEEQQKYQKAKEMFERLTKEHPDTEKGKNAVLDIRRIEILEAIQTGDLQTKGALLTKFVADFNQNPYAGNCLSAIGIKFYNKGSALKESEVKNSDTDICFQIAADVLERIVNQLPPCSKTAESCYFAGVCCREHFGDYEKAIMYYQKVLDEWPNYEHAWHAQYSIGDCYEKLLENGKLSRSEAMPEIINAYKTVVEKYPNCRKAKGAMLKLKALGYEQN